MLTGSALMVNNVAADGITLPTARAAQVPTLTISAEKNLPRLSTGVSADPRHDTAFVSHAAIMLYGSVSTAAILTTKEKSTIQFGHFLVDVISSFQRNAERGRQTYLAVCLRIQLVLCNYTYHEQLSVDKITTSRTEWRLVTFPLEVLASDADDNYLANEL